MYIDKYLFFLKKLKDFNDKTLEDYLENYKIQLLWDKRDCCDSFKRNCGSVLVTIIVLGQIFFLDNFIIYDYFFNTSCSTQM
jgi:hypothetical protein